MFRADGVALEEPSWQEAAEDEIASAEADYYTETEHDEEEPEGVLVATPAFTTIKGAAPESAGPRSVILACLIGVLIAGAIVAGAFFLRPASTSSEAPTPNAASSASE